MKKYKTGFTASSFDLLHAGHVLMLKESKDQCEKLIVGFNKAPVGKDFIQSAEERLIQLQAIKYVDEIIPYNSENELLEILKKVQPDVRFLGDDYRHRNDFTGAELNIPLFFNNRDHGYSTSELKERTAVKSNLYKEIIKNVK